MARTPESAITFEPVPFDGSEQLPILSDRKSRCLNGLYITMPRAVGYTASRLAFQKYLEMASPLLKKGDTATECTEIERVKRRVLSSCGIPPEYLRQPDLRYIEGPSLSELLEEVEGKKEDNMDSLMDRKIKKVVILCEDGSTYEGSITRIEGNPYNLRSTLVEARISNSAVGHYGIKEVIFANPSTIVKWTDGTETVVSCMDNVKTIKKMVNGKNVTKRKPMKSKTYSKEVGLAMCIVKKWGGNKGNFNNIFRKYIENYTEGKK